MREMSGSTAASATSKISEISPAISRLKAATDALPVSPRLVILPRRSGSASSPSSVHASSDRSLALETDAFSKSPSMTARSTRSTACDSLTSLRRVSPKRLPDEAR